MQPTPDIPRRRRLGGSSIEYMMVLALVVIPLALLVPLITRMVATYGERIFAVIRWPFG
ncbi:MAG TPA: hypothetical protein VHQ47_17085 [Phycisphaerae bacterium]|jgi:hypothetical protein|nr:hypothetical protein [Phycisphaerae bacterium]